jgi:NADPH2:quinone reductase
VRALVIRRPGGADVMQLEVLADPGPGPGEVLVAVEAVGVNPVDASNRADPRWAGIRPPYVVGYEFAGSVVAIGEGAGAHAVGQAVWGLLPVRGTRWGAYAQLVCAAAESIAPRPSELAAEEAAALPLVGSTGLQLLERLGLAAGDWVLVHGAAGGVGSVLVQLARAQGLRVAVVARKQRHALLRELGVEVIVDLDADDAPRRAVAAIGSAPQGVIDLVGGGLLNRSLELVAEGGSAASIVELAGDLEQAIDRNISLHGVLVRPSRDDLERLSAEVHAHRLRPVLDRVLPLEQAPDAHRRIETGHGQGKLVLRVEPT